MHFYGWKAGLKTGMYYLRSRPAVDAIKFTLNMEELLNATDKNDTEKVLHALSHAPTEQGSDSKDTKKDVLVVKKEEKDEVCISCSG